MITAFCSEFSQKKEYWLPLILTLSANHSDKPPGVLNRGNRTLAEEFIVYSRIIFFFIFIKGN
jgi:hypothetical protein